MSTGKKVAIEIELLDRISGGLDRINRKMDGMSNSARQARKELDSMDGMTQKLKNSLAQLGLAFSIKEFGQAVVDVRSKIETLQTSFSVLLGDKDKADALFGSIKQFAATTPMMMDDLASGAQTMLGFGIESEKVMEYLKALGDISMGDSQRFQSLTLAFSQMSATGKLMGQDLLQMINAGFNPLKVISEQTGKSIGELKDDMSKGAISAEEVQKAFLAAASSGGQFDGMLEKLSNTQEGALSNLRGAWDDFLNAIGEQTEGAVVTAATGLTDLLHNYEQLGTVLLGIIGTYGTYKAALMLVTAAEGWATAAEAIHYNWLLLVEKAQKLLNATMLNNPYVLVATVAAGLVATLITLYDSTTAEELAQQNLNSTMETLTEQQKKYNEETENAISLAQDDSKATSDRDAAMQTLIQRYPQIIQKYIDEEGHLRNILELKKEIAEYDGKKQRQETTDTLKNQKDRYRQVMEIYALIRDGRKLTTEQQKVWNSVYNEYASTHSMALYKNKDLYDYAKASFNQYDTKYRRNLTENRIADFTGDNGALGKMTDAQLKALQKKLQDNKTAGKKNTSVFISELGDYLTYNDRDALLTRIQGMITARGEKKSTPAQHKAALKAARDEAKRKLDEFDNSNTGYSDKKYEEERKKLVDALDAAEKKYKAAGGDSVKNETAAANRNAKAQQTAAAKAETERQKEERAEEQRRQAKEKLGQELAELQRRNDAEEIAAMQEGLEKKLRQIENDYQARKNEIDKQEAEWKRENKKAGLEVGENGLTDEQTQAITKAREQNDKTRTKDIAEANAEELKAELEAMSEYLQQYGTLQEQKYAIAKEYAQKIKEVQEGAGSDEEKKWRVKSLERERDSKMAQNGAADLAMSIDWGTAFEGVGNVLRNIAKETLGKVEAYMKTPEFKKLSAQDKKTYTDLRQKLVSETGGNSTSAFNFGIWGTIAQNVRSYQQSVKTLQEKTQLHADSVNRLEEAQDNLANATDDTSKEMAKKAVEMAQQMVENTGNDVKDAQEKSDKAKQELTDNTNAAAQGIQNFTSYLNEMSNGSLYGFANGISKLVTSLGKGSDGVGKSLNELGGKIGGIIGAILQIIDALGDDPKGFIDDLLQRIGDTVEQILEQLPEIIGAVLKDVGGIVQGVFSGIASWFGADDLFGLNGNEKEVQDTIDRLTKRNELLQYAIEDLTDTIEAGKGTQSVAAYQEAYKNQKETNRNYLDMAKAQAGYWKHHHSWNYYWDGFDSSQMAWIRQNVKENFNGDLFSLTPEEMKKLRSNVGIWEDIQNTGKGGYGERLTDKLNDYIDQAGKLEELTNSLYESLTGISFDSMYDSFVDALMDMSKSGKDMADDLSEYFMRAMLSNKIGELYQDKLKAWWEEFGKAMEDNELTEAERKALSDEYMQYVNEAMALRDNLAAATGYDKTASTSQTGKSGGFTAMTQDQGTKLEGLFTSGLQHWSAMDANLEIVTDRMSTAESHLARIAENTGVSAAQLKEIKEQVYAIKRDGLKMK